jgi:hypothetical protein
MTRTAELLSTGDADFNGLVARVFPPYIDAAGRLIDVVAVVPGELGRAFGFQALVLFLEPRPFGYQGGDGFVTCASVLTARTVHHRIGAGVCCKYRNLFVGQHGVSNRGK